MHAKKFPILILFSLLSFKAAIAQVDNPPVINVASDTRVNELPYLTAVRQNTPIGFTLTISDPDTEQGMFNLRYTSDNLALKRVGTDTNNLLVREVEVKAGNTFTFSGSDDPIALITIIATDHNDQSLFARQIVTLSLVDIDTRPIFGLEVIGEFRSSINIVANDETLLEFGPFGIFQDDERHAVTTSIFTSSQIEIAAVPPAIPIFPTSYILRRTGTFQSGSTHIVTLVGAQVKDLSTANPVQTTVLITFNVVANLAAAVSNLSNQTLRIPEDRRLGNRRTGISFNVTEPKPFQTFNVGIVNAVSSQFQVSSQRGGFFLSPVTTYFLELKQNAMFDYEATNNGNVLVTLNISDNNGSTDGDISGKYTVTVKVTDLDDPAVLARSIPTVLVYQNTTVSYSIPAGTFTDADSGVISITFDNAGASWLSYDAVSGLITGNPPRDGSFPRDIRVSLIANSPGATDHINQAIAPILFRLSADNAPGNLTRVVVSGAQNINIPEGNVRRKVDTGIRIAGASGIALSDDRFLLENGNLMIKENAVFDYDLQPRVVVNAIIGNNEGYSAATAVTLIIANTNDEEPMIAFNTGSDRNEVSVPESYIYYYDTPIVAFSINDADGQQFDAVTYSISDTFHFNVVNNNVEVRSYVAFDYESKNTYTVTVTARDSANNAASAVLTVRVYDVDEAPYVANQVTDLTVLNNTNLSFRVPFKTFGDPENRVLRYSAVTPNWLNFNNTTRQLSGTASGVGYSTITVIATDSAGFMASDSFVVRVVGSGSAVGDIGVNHVDAISAVVDENFSYGVNHDIGYRLSYSGGLDTRKVQVSDNRFVLSPDKVTVFVKQGASFDYERDAVVEFEVFAVLGSGVASESLRLTIRDVNDLAPGVEILNGAVPAIEENSVFTLGQATITINGVAQRVGKSAGISLRLTNDVAVGANFLSIRFNDSRLTTIYDVRVKDVANQPNQLEIHFFFKPGAHLDFETVGSYPSRSNSDARISFQVIDTSYRNYTPHEITVMANTVSEVNEAPVLSNPIPSALNIQQGTNNDTTIAFGNDLFVDPEGEAVTFSLAVASGQNTRLVGNTIVSRGTSGSAVVITLYGKDDDNNESAPYVVTLNMESSYTNTKRAVAVNNLTIEIADGYQYSGRYFTGIYYVFDGGAPNNVRFSDNRFDISIVTVPITIGGNVVNQIRGSLAIASSPYVLGCNERAHVAQPYCTRAFALFDYEAQQNLALTMYATYTGDREKHSVINLKITPKNDHAPEISVAGSNNAINAGVTDRAYDTGFSFTASDDDGNNTLGNFTVNNDKFMMTPGLSNAMLQIKQGVRLDYEMTGGKLTVTVAISDEDTTTAKVQVVSFADVSVSSPEVFISRVVNHSGVYEGINNNNIFTGIHVSVRANGKSIANIGIGGSQFFLAGNNRDLYLARGQSFDYGRVNPNPVPVTVNVGFFDENGAVQTASRVVGVSIQNRVQAPYFVTAVPNQTVAVGSNFSFSLPAIRFDSSSTNTSVRVLNIAEENPSWLAFDRNAISFSGRPPRESATAITVLVSDLSNNTGVTARFTLAAVINDVAIANNIQELDKEIGTDLIKSISGHNINNLSKRVSDTRINNSNAYSMLGATGDTLLDLINNKRDAINKGEISLVEFFQDQDFVIALGSNHSSGLVGGFELWGRGNLSSLEGTDNDTTYEGEHFSLNMGVDRSFGRGLVGFAYAYNKADIEYDNTFIQDDAYDGEYSLDLNIVQPYVAFDPVRNVRVWSALGVGIGTLSNKNNTNVAARFFNTERDASYLSFLTGVNVPLANMFPGLVSNLGPNAKLDLRSDFAYAKLDLGASESIAQSTASTIAFVENDFDNSSFRFGLEYSNLFEFDNSGGIEPHLGFALRNDWNDVDESNLFGYEVNAGIAYVSRARLKVSADTRIISLSSGDYQEVGVGLGVNLRPAAANLGASFKVEPSYGSSNEQNIWDIHTSNDIMGLINSDYKLKVDSEVGYGFGLRGGVLTPYGSYQLNDKDAKYGLGIRLNEGENLRWKLNYAANADKFNDGEYKLQYIIRD